MPSLSKSKCWFVRIDGPHDWHFEKIKEVKQWVDTVRLLGFLHKGEKGDNPHCHFVIEMSSELQKQSFDARIKKLYSVSGTNYSSKVWDGGDSACSYMFHESDHTMYVCKGFTLDDLEKFRSLNEATQKVVAINKQKASNKLVDKCYEALKDEKFDRVKCLLFMLKEIKAGNNYHPGEFMLKRYVEEIEVRMCGDLEYLAQDLAFRMWR